MKNTGIFLIYFSISFGLIVNLFEGDSLFSRIILYTGTIVAWGALGAGLFFYYKGFRKNKQ